MRTTFLFVFLLVLGISCQVVGTGQKAYKDVNRSQWESIESQQKQDTVVVDVRTDREWQQGRIAGAKHIPIAELEGRLSEIAKDKKVLLYCHSGGRSSRAAKLLVERGYKQVYNLKGGIAAWGN
ncbi:MAG: rhodanese-like domain-containing protein [Spirochaetota bacterium]